jgi:Protein of unknown function (DUF1579)
LAGSPIFPTLIAKSKFAFMKHKFLAICAAAFLFTSCNNEKTEGETSSKDSSGKDTKMEKMEDNAKKEWVPYDTAQENKAWMESMTLGEPHKMLAKGAGTWNADMTMWMTNGEPPMKMTATSVNTMVLNGAYQQSKHTGTMMGMPFEGMSTTGYDNVKKEYFSTWIDNMGTGLMVMTGNWDNSTKSLTLSGKMKNPVNGMECTEREVFTFPDDNHQTLEMYGPDRKTGKEFKMMEIKYTRKK